MMKNEEEKVSRKRKTEKQTIRLNLNIKVILSEFFDILTTHWMILDLLMALWYFCFVFSGWLVGCLVAWLTKCLGWLADLMVSCRIVVNVDCCWCCLICMYSCTTQRINVNSSGNCQYKRRNCFLSCSCINSPSFYCLKRL